MFERTPSEAVYRLVYRSFACPPWLPEKTLADICAESQSQNVRDHVTGVLSFRDGVFLQVMEGSVMAVLSLSARIAADGRNERLRILWHGHAASRLFPEWPMGCFLGDAGDPALDPLAEWTAERTRDLSQFYAEHQQLGKTPAFTVARRLT